MLWPICQRYNLKAIHNISANRVGTIDVVTNMSKIQSESNSQLAPRRGKPKSVVTNMSKIQSESNSQPWGIKSKKGNGCDQYVKDTIWKQFTTTSSCRCQRPALWPICQRYNLKAIHNYHEPNAGADNVVTNMSKIQSESNSQRCSSRNSLAQCCDQYVKDTIWKQFTTELAHRRLVEKLWPICQRYNLKAIHNSIYKVVFARNVVTNMSKIQSESNSQLARSTATNWASCDQYVKDTIWKQFTTGL